MRKTIPFSHSRVENHTAFIQRHENGEHLYFARGDYATYHLVDTDINPTAMIDCGGGRKVEMSYPDLTCVKHSVQGHKVKMESEDNVTLQYSTFNHSIKQEIIIQKPPNANVFTEIIYLKNLSLVHEATGWVLMDKGGNNTGYMLEPTVTDSNMRKPVPQNAYTFELVPVTKNTYKFSITLDKMFLQNATYPIIIDPTITTGYINDGLVVNNNRTIFTMSNGDVITLGCNQQQIYCTISTDNGQTWGAEISTGLSSYNLMSYTGTLGNGGNTLFIGAVYANVGVKVGAFDYDLTNHTFSYSTISAQGIYRNFSNIALAWNSAGQFLHAYTLDNTNNNTYLTGFSYTYNHQVLILTDSTNVSSYSVDTNSVCAAISSGAANYVLVAENGSLMLMGFGKYISGGSTVNEYVSNRVRSVGSQYTCTFVPDNAGNFHFIYSTGTNTAEYLERTIKGIYQGITNMPLSMGSMDSTQCLALLQGQLSYETDNNSLVFLYSARFDLGYQIGILSMMIGTSGWETYNIHLQYPTTSYDIEYVSIEESFTKIWKSRISFLYSNESYIDDFLSGELLPTIYITTDIIGQSYDDSISLDWTSIYTDNVAVTVSDATGSVLFSNPHVTNTGITLETLGWPNGEYIISLVPSKNGTQLGTTRELDVTILHQINLNSLSTVYTDNIFLATTAAVGGIATSNYLSFLVVMDSAGNNGGIYYYNSNSSSEWTKILEQGLTSYSGGQRGQGGLTAIGKLLWGIYVDANSLVQLYCFNIQTTALQGITKVKMIDSSGNTWMPNVDSFAISTDGTNILIYDGSLGVVKVFGTSIVHGIVTEINELSATYAMNTDLNHQFGYDGTSMFWAQNNNLIKYSSGGSQTSIKNIFGFPTNFIAYDPIYDIISACAINNNHVSLQQIYTVSSSYLMPPVIISPKQDQIFDKYVTVQWQPPADIYAPIQNYKWFVLNSEGAIPSGAYGTTNSTTLQVNMNNGTVYPNDKYAFYLSAVDTNNSQSANAQLNFQLIHSVPPAAPTLTFTGDVSPIQEINANVDFTLATSDAGTNMTGYVYTVVNLETGQDLFNSKTVPATDTTPIDLTVTMVGAANGNYVIQVYAMGLDREGDIIVSSTVQSAMITINAQFAPPELIAWPASSVAINENAVVSWELDFSPHDGQAVEDYYYYLSDSNGNIVLPITLTYNTSVTLNQNVLPSLKENMIYTFYLYGQDSLNNKSPISSQEIAFSPISLLLNYDVVYPLNKSQQLSSIGVPIFYQYPGDGTTSITSLRFSTYITEYVNSEQNVTSCYCHWYVLDVNDILVSSDTVAYTAPPVGFINPAAIGVATIDLNTHNLVSGLEYTLYVQQVTDKYSSFASAMFFANQDGAAMYLSEPDIINIPSQYPVNKTAGFTWSIPDVISNNTAAPGMVYSGTIAQNTLAITKYYYEVTDQVENNVYAQQTALLPNVNSLVLDTSDTSLYKSGQVYRFIIKAMDNTGNMSFPNKVDFLVDHSMIVSLPNAPIWILPISNAGTTMNPRPRFQFKLSDPLSNSVQGFRLQVAIDQNFTNLVFDSQDIHQPAANDTVVSYIPNQNIIQDTSTSATYFVRVFGWNNNGNSLPSFPLQINFQAQNWLPLVSSRSFLTIQYIQQLRTTVEASLEFYGMQPPNWTPIHVNSIITYTMLEEIFLAINILLKQEGMNVQFVLHRGKVLRLNDLVSLETDIAQS